MFTSYSTETLRTMADAADTLLDAELRQPTLSAAERATLCAKRLAMRAELASR